MKILFATDGSEFSESAARFLTRMEWSPDDSITVFHSIYEVPFRSDEQFYLTTLAAIKKELAPRIIDSALAILQPIRATVSAQIRESSPLRCTPEQCIIDEAEALRADLIVMGARGIKGIASIFLGSVTRLVTLQAKRPVLVVKPSERTAADRLKILFAVDGSDDSLYTGEFLSSLPFPGTTEVTILNVIASSFTDIPAHFAMEVNEQIKKVVADARSIEYAQSKQILDHAGDTLRKRFSRIEVVSTVGDPSTEILALGGKIGADIIAVGSRGLRGIKGVLGSISRNILTHSKCSVLIGNRRT